jgi:stress response protein YsnF/sporulation protein YlmC with PRC-barrel domain
MSLNENEYSNLRELSDSDFEIKDGQPEIIGWDVYDLEQNEIGEVQDLLFDPETNNVRYLIVDLESNDFGIDQKLVLLPIGIAELHQRDDEVILPEVSEEQLAALPPYEKGKVNFETELSIRRIFKDVSAARISDTAWSDPVQFYNHDHFNENKFYNRTKQPIIYEDLSIGKEPVETGSATIAVRTVETLVEETLNITEEQVNIYRIPVDRNVHNSEAAFKEEELEITEHAEVPFVIKEARVVEEIVINKFVEEREETIKGTLKSTEVKLDQVNLNGNGQRLDEV